MSVYIIFFTTHTCVCISFDIPNTLTHTLQAQTHITHGSTHTTYTCIRALARAHTHTYTHVHSNRYTHAHTYLHTHTHTHTLDTQQITKMYLKNDFAFDCFTSVPVQGSGFRV
jgi:hypothetical protein